jgi:uncharacterized OsmC-like protein
VVGEVEMLHYEVVAYRVDAHGSTASCKSANIVLDTDVKGRTDAFNPAELFLASIAACMLKGIERVTPLIGFELRGVSVHLVARRQDTPPMIVSVVYDLVVDTDENDQRLELLHTNVRKYGTIFNTVSAASGLVGNIRRSPA